MNVIDGHSDAHNRRARSLNIRFQTDIDNNNRRQSTQSHVNKRN